MKSLLIIFNPVSGRGDAGSIIPKLLSYYQNLGYMATVYVTDGKNDGEHISKCAKNYEFIICIGGDGTLHDVIVLLHNIGWKGRLGYIPRGSTNDISRSLIISSRPDIKYEATVMSVDEWIKKTMTEQFIRLDVGKINENYFAYVAAFGLFTDVTYTVTQENKNRYGYLAYIMDGARSLSRFKIVYAHIKNDEIDIEDYFIAGIISNSFSIAGFKNPMASKTRLDDGLLECMFIKKPKNIFETNEIIAALLLEDSINRNIVTFQCSNLTIVSDPIEWTLDGEYGGQTESAEISVIRNAVELSI